MFSPVDEVTCGPDARVYAEGWQSWSPTTWWRAFSDADRPAETWQHLMRFRPDEAPPERGIQGEGLLVVDPGGGRPAVRYAVGDAATKVTSIRAEGRGGVLAITANGPVTRTEHAGAAEALDSFGAAFGRAAGVRVRPAPRVWCSWYRYFGDVTSADVLENLAAFADAGLSVDVVQIDDGWDSAAFGSLPKTVATIRGTGRQAGVWLAPFLVGRGSKLAREHPAWLTGPAGFNWGDNLVGLDLTHPGVRDRLAASVGRLAAMGVTYFKLDFLYAGAVPGRRASGANPIEAYRSGLALIREAAGPDAFLLGCGAPILPSVGLVDAMRVSPDTFHEGGEDGSAGLRGARNVAARAWQHGRLWLNDPDCLVMRPHYRLRDEWATIVRAHPGLRSFSDRVGELDAHGLAVVRAHLGEGR